MPLFYNKKNLYKIYVQNFYISEIKSFAAKQQKVVVENFMERIG